MTVGLVAASIAPITAFTGTERTLRALDWRGVRHSRSNLIGSHSLGADMDITTLLIIVVIVMLLGGGWYGRGRWY